MKIAYVANHDQPNSDDEGAITYALEKLGHRVERLRESVGNRVQRLRPDLVLFHKWHDELTLKRLQGHTPTVFWYFDLVDWPGDPTLAGRCKTRIDWMNRVVPLVDLGFCTDGDWVANSGYKNLVWLTQGADGRITGMEKKLKRCDILLVGIGKGGGTQRESFVQELRDKYGREFCHIERGVYREGLRSLIAQAKVVVAPDSPVTDRYYSNRVYNMLGFGACLLHPYSSALATQYEECEEIWFYHDRVDLHEQIKKLLPQAEACRILGENGLQRTEKEHLYLHRVELLLKTIKDKLGVS